MLVVRRALERTGEEHGDVYQPNGTDGAAMAARRSSATDTIAAR